MKPGLVALSLAGISLGLAAPIHAAPAPVSAEEAREIAVEAYVYAYPIVLMDLSRKVMTNTEAPNTETRRAPINQFYHAPVFPDASFTDVVRANADTLYSFLWFDVSQEPLVIDVPDSGGRYYLLPMLDLWTDVFASPGKRTSGTRPQTYAITGPAWKGVLPAGVAELRSPGADKESNWLPTPGSGGFSMNLRLYWPEPVVLDGIWQPPAVKRLE